MKKLLLLSALTLAIVGSAVVEVTICSQAAYADTGGCSSC